MAATTLREKQRAVVHSMLTRASSDGAVASGSEQWRVLVFDDTGMDILAPLVRVKELREANVTLHLKLHAQRQPVARVPAVYFCEPSTANVERIAADAKDELYEEMDIHFTSQVPRSTLEALAERLCVLPSVAHIKVTDQTLHFISLEANLFSLNFKATFRALNSRTSDEAAILELLDAVSTRLAHIFLTYDTVPIVAHVKSGPATELASRVSRHLSDLVKDRQLSAASTPSQPTLLLIVDRSHDLVAPLHHPFSYRSLLGETHGMASNKVTVDTKGKPQSYEIDPETDDFWPAISARRFEDASRMIDEAVASYKTEYAALTAADSQQGGAALPAGDTSDSNSSASKLLAAAPKLAERKKALDVHTHLGYAVLNSVRRRRLDMYHGVEDSIIRREEMDRGAFADLIGQKDTTAVAVAGAAPSDPAAVAAATELLSDKQRLLLLATLLCEGDEARFVEEQLATISTAGDSFDALAFVKSIQAWAMPGAGASPSATNNTTASGWGLAQTLQRNLAKAFTSAENTTVLPVTRIVEALLAQPSGTSTARERRRTTLESVVAADPRNPSTPIDLEKMTRLGSVLVFVVGGGCTAEYDNLMKVVPNASKQVCYGCTEMLTGKEFLAQLSALGAESRS